MDRRELRVAECCMLSDSKKRISEDHRRSGIHLEHGHSMQRPYRPVSHGISEGRRRSRSKIDHFQHHYGFGRNLDGNRRHEIFAGLQGGDRRFDRDCCGMRRFRRFGGDRRLRQKHAGLPDRLGTIEPSIGVCLWRNDPPRLYWQPEHRYRLHFRSGGCPFQRENFRWRTGAS